MKINQLNKKTIFGMFAATAVIFASCSDTNVAEEAGNPESSAEEVAGESNLTTVQLATFAGNPDRVTYVGTRAEGDENSSTPLQFVASIDNPSKAEGFNFTKEEGGRWMSATSVFYDESTSTYYASYHIQGNNYNTTIENEIAGAIQSFKVAEDGSVTLGKGFRAENPNDEDFDFNHLYFDNPDARWSNSGLPKRIIAVGHKVKDGNSQNTRAIIAEFDPVNEKLIYAPITTAEKKYDGNDKSLGYEDAGDANCVTSLVVYPHYYVTTRKGIAVLNSDFSPVLNTDGTKYFIPTPGSAKFVFNNPEVGSGMDFLYLSESHKSTSYETSSSAKIATFQVATGSSNSFLGLMNPSSPWTTYYDSKDLEILSYERQITLPEQVSPTDGKNVVHALSYSEYYAALGTGGLYYKFKGANTYQDFEGVIKFKGTNNNLPVNCVYVDRAEMESGHDGFIYVACGARLVVLHRKTFEVVAYWNIPTKKNGEDIEVEASANYIYVKMGPENDWQPRERIITVAFGQEGLKVFKFNPAVLNKKTVWEKTAETLPTEVKF